MAPQIRQAQSRLETESRVEAALAAYAEGHIRGWTQTDVAGPPVPEAMWGRILDALPAPADRGARADQDPTSDREDCPPIEDRPVGRPAATHPAGDYGSAALLRTPSDTTP